MLIEFLGAAGDCADNLNLIGSEGLGMLYTWASAGGLATPGFSYIILIK